MKKLRTNTDNCRRPAVHLFDHPRRHPYRALKDLFELYSLQGIRNELNNWLTLALCAEESNFQDTESRKRLLNFCERLLKLIEALSLLQMERRRLKKPALSNSLPVDPFPEDRPCLLSPAQQPQPMRCLQKFFDCYTAGYADSMLLDMMEATLMCIKAKKLQAPDPVFFYRCMRGFVRAGKAICREERFEKVQGSRFKVQR